MYCPVPRQTAGLRVRNPGSTVLYGMVLNVQCVTGYYITGQSQSTTQKHMICGNGGQWTPSVPSCSRKCYLSRRLIVPVTSKLFEENPAEIDPEGNGVKHKAYLELVFTGLIELRQSEW